MVSAAVRRRAGRRPRTGTYSGEGNEARCRAGRREPVNLSGQGASGDRPSRRPCSASAGRGPAPAGRRGRGAGRRRRCGRTPRRHRAGRRSSRCPGRRAGCREPQRASLGEPHEVVVGAARGVPQHAVDGARAAQYGQQPLGEHVGRPGPRRGPLAAARRLRGRRAGTGGRGAAPGPHRREVPRGRRRHRAGRAGRRAAGRRPRGCSRARRAGRGAAGATRVLPARRASARTPRRPGHHLVHVPSPFVRTGTYRSVTCCWGSCTRRGRAVARTPAARRGVRGVHLSEWPDGRRPGRATGRTG